MKSSKEIGKMLCKATIQSNKAHKRIIFYSIVVLSIPSKAQLFHSLHTILMTQYNPWTSHSFHFQWRLNLLVKIKKRAFSLHAFSSYDILNTNWLSTTNTAANIITSDRKIHFMSIAVNINLYPAKKEKKKEINLWMAIPLCITWTILCP